MSKVESTLPVAHEEFPYIVQGIGLPIFELKLPLSIEYTHCKSYDLVTPGRISAVDWRLKVPDDEKLEDIFNGPVLAVEHLLGFLRQGRLGPDTYRLTGSLLIISGAPTQTDSSRSKTKPAR